jgi:GT2 family glycosyltransferase
MARQTVSIITPVWNQIEHTLHYLHQNRDVKAQFIIIDNGSTDDTPRILEDWREAYEGWLTVITNSKNEGFPVACNQGASVAMGDILLFLNNDTLNYGDYVPFIQQAVTDNVIAGPELNTRDTGWNRFGDVLVPYIAGWCLAVTRKTFNDLYGFDERYSPADYEDVDLCYNAVKQGKNLLWLNLPIRHISGVSGQQLANRRELTEVNRRKFAEKWGL